MKEIGRVIKFYNSFFFVKVDNELIPCKLRGLLKRDKKIGSAVCVGDFVEISILKDKSGVIENVQSRRNFLIRPPIANVDRVILTFAFVPSKLFAIYAKHLSISFASPVIVLNETKSLIVSIKSIFIFLIKKLCLL